MDGIFNVIREHWYSNILQVISLVELISVELKEEFKVYLPSLVPPMLKVLHTDTSQKRQATRKVIIFYCYYYYDFILLLLLLLFIIIINIL